ncbi:hypothetical protein STEG23_015072, partial [Scotinomys teguina]
FPGLLLPSPQLCGKPPAAAYPPSLPPSVTDYMGLPLQGEYLDQETSFNICQLLSCCWTSALIQFPRYYEYSA